MDESSLRYPGWRVAAASGAGLLIDRIFAARVAFVLLSVVAVGTSCCP